MNPATLTQPLPDGPYPPEHGSGVPSLTLQLAPNPADTALATVGRSVPAEPPQHSALATLNSALPKKPRNGKIARLPKPVRDVVNRMLFNHIPQQNIVDALDEIGIQVTQRNISNWKTHGGYHEWRLAQEHALQLRLHQDNLLDHIRRHDASELPELGLQLAATQLSQFFLTPDAQQLLASHPKEYQRRVAMLNSISAQLKGAQKYRDDSAKALGYKQDPARIRHDTVDQLAKLRHDFSADVGEGPEDPILPHRNELPNPSEVFHLAPPPEPGLFDHLKPFLAAARSHPPESPLDRDPGPDPTNGLSEKTTRA